MKDKARADSLADEFLRDARNERMKSAQRRDRFWKSGVGTWRVAGIFLGLTLGWLLGLWLNDFKVALMIGGIIVGALLGTITDYRLRNE